MGGSRDCIRQEKQEDGKDTKVSSFAYQLFLVGARRLASFEDTSYYTMPYSSKQDGWL